MVVGFVSVEDFCLNVEIVFFLTTNKRFFSNLLMFFIW